MKTLRIAFVLAAMMSLATSAFALGKGSSMFSIQLGSGTADLVSNSADYVTSYQLNVLEPKVEFSHLFKDDYAFNIATGLGYFKETDKSRTTGVGDQETTVSAFFVRVGGDRIVKIGERANVFFGPGIEYWSGSADYAAPGIDESGESTSRISLVGRIGGTMMLGESVGFTVQAGNRKGLASAKWDGAEANWTSGSTFGSGGLTFLFGGN